MMLQHVKSTLLLKHSSINKKHVLIWSFYVFLLKVEASGFIARCIELKIKKKTHKIYEIMKVFGTLKTI